MRVRTGDRANLQWYGFGDLTPVLLYELLQFRQAIFVVEQSCAYPDLDGLDQRAQHLLLRVEGALAGCLRLIPFPDETRVKIGRVAVALARRKRGLAGVLMKDALARCRRDYPGCTVTLTGQTYLAPFYESLGFRRELSALRRLRPVACRYGSQPLSRPVWREQSSRTS